MLAEYSSSISKLSITLGSQSPRRHQIFRENLGLNFQVLVSNFAEDISKSSCHGPADYVRQTCFTKAKDIITQHYSNDLLQASFPHVIVTSDTIVVQGNEILEKPTSRENCQYILSKLSDTSHEVITAVSIAVLRRNLEIPPSYSVEVGAYNMNTFTESTTVEFAKLSDSVIRAYMDSGEPFDKAGGYGIQGLGSSFVKGIYGCFFNVMGFPVHRFCAEFIPYLKLLEKEGPYF